MPHSKYTEALVLNVIVSIKKANLPRVNRNNVRLFYVFRLGGKLVCMPYFSQDEFIKVLEEYRPTQLNIVPPIVQMLAHNKRITPRHVENVKMILSGAAPIGDESIAMFQSRVSDSVTFCQG